MVRTNLLIITDNYIFVDNYSSIIVDEYIFINNFVIYFLFHFSSFGSRPPFHLILFYINFIDKLLKKIKLLMVLWTNFTMNGITKQNEENFNLHFTYRFYR